MRLCSFPGCHWTSARSNDLSHWQEFTLAWGALCTCVVCIALSTGHVLHCFMYGLHFLRWNVLFLSVWCVLKAVQYTVCFTTKDNSVTVTVSDVIHSVKYEN